MSEDRPRYSCAACPYRGDAFETEFDGSKGGTAVCPECGEAALRLTLALETA